MLHLDGFTQESLDTINSMLFAEGQVNPYEGKCNQRQLRQQNKQQRTPEQQAADQKRSQSAQQSMASRPSAVRSEAAKKAAQTRKMCQGGKTMQTSTV